MIATISDDVKAAILAQTFAREMGLPPGNLWEPPVARKINEQLASGNSLPDIEQQYRFRLGLERDME